MHLIVKRPGESPKERSILKGDVEKQIKFMHLTDTYEIPGLPYVVLYNGSLPTSRERNFTVHADGCLICGTAYIMRQSSYGNGLIGLPYSDQIVVMDWLRNHCSWIREDDG